MTELRLEHDHDPRREDLVELQRGLIAFNQRHGVPREEVPLALFVRDAADTVRGGLWGRSYWGWMFVKWLWVAEELRGQGWGRKLMEQAEAVARERGCRGVFLDTFSFQAPDFYLALGYEVFAELEDLPPGGSRLYFRKLLA